VSLVPTNIEDVVTWMSDGLQSYSRYLLLEYTQGLAS